MSLPLQPTLKKVEPNFGSSFVLRNFSASSQSEVPKWHYHPEIEIVYIQSGEGQRHIGNHVSNFYNGDLMVIGSNLPHYGFPTRLTGNHREIVLQVNVDSFGKEFLNMVELADITRLFEQAKLGLSFHGETKRRIGECLQTMFRMNSFEKLMELITVLHDLSISKEYEILNAKGNFLHASGNDLQKIDIIYAYVHNNFRNRILLKNIADDVNMTIPALCRFFKRSTGKTIVQFTNDYRITHSCQLLCQRDDNISNIAFVCGFQNVSNYNRAFRKTTGMSPSEFRKRRTSIYRPTEIGH